MKLTESLGRGLKNDRDKKTKTIVLKLWTILFFKNVDKKMFDI